MKPVISRFPFLDRKSVSWARFSCSNTRRTLFHEAQNEKEPNLLECAIWGRQGQRNIFEMWGVGGHKVSLFEGKAPVGVAELSGLKKAGKHEIVIYNFALGFQVCGICLYLQLIIRKNLLRRTNSV
ncbi:hypothetical protein CEXT_53191 [Caerostris extrusa]|uniref:Uncharacterized protein n=1 Tax=Caerostris extrusa TaxID=172846 RepID=A0AAV4P8C3_CAEEX|nr:hypothetical protein CEXT_53191 [Caerostris extrusa]